MLVSFCAPPPRVSSHHSGLVLPGTGRGCPGYSPEFFVSGRQQRPNVMAKSSSGGQDSAKDSGDEMIFAAESTCALPPEGDGEARLGPPGAVLPARKRSRAFEDEDERQPATGPRRWAGASKKTPRHPLSPSCPRPGEARWEAEGPVSRPGESRGGDPEDDGPDPDPDPHYGLLGSLPGQEPQSRICSLPSEVLRHIFAFLPVEDLYWSLSLVCHLWREIISDPLVRGPRLPCVCSARARAPSPRLSFCP